MLYHDRLRTYLLQKLSDYEVQDLNEILISYLENSLNDEESTEAEFYALEYLSTHLVVESQLGIKYERLNNFVNQEDLWERQIKKSNEYKWSKRSVQYAIKEAARRQDDFNTLNNTLSCYRLYNNELNSISDILSNLKDGNIFMR